jgi:hypothetical protein
MNVTKRLFGALCALALVLTVAAPAAAQQPGPPPGHGGQPPQMPMQGGGMMGDGTMMCPMMSGMMGGGMKGMMGGQAMGGQMDPKTLGRMLQMHGEMLKAVGDVLIKHGKEIESQAAK